MPNTDIAHQLSVALSADLQAFKTVPFITSDMDSVEVAVHALRGSFLKKWEPQGVSKRAESAAFAVFQTVNERMRNWTLQLETMEDEYLIGHFVSQLHELLGWRIGDECDFAAIADGVGFGPGAVVGADSSTFHTKVFESTLTATSDWLISLYRTAVSRSPTWALAEKQRFDRFGFGIVEGCRLFFAPKYTHIARTCSTQPAVNMALQKGVDSFTLSRLREWDIDLSLEPDRNRELARRASVTGDFTTIDLTSASDCTSLALAKFSLPQPFLKWVLATRTPVTEFQNRKIELGMVSMMGNAFTFSLETAIFAAVVRAVYQLRGLPLWEGKSKNFGVFGDDLIVRREAHSMVVRLLGLLGYEVNVDKTFHAGSFRESCGADFFGGYPVRGVYLRRLRDDADRYSAINRLNRWSALHGVPLPCVVKLIHGGIRARKAFLVPPSEQDDAGIKVPFKATRPRVTDDYCFQYRKLQSRPKRWHPVYTPDGSFNASFGVAVLGGYLRGPDHCLSLPDDHPFGGFVNRKPGTPGPIHDGNVREPDRAVRRLKVVVDTIPWWDWLPRDVYQGISRGSWEAAVAGNEPRAR